MKRERDERWEGKRAEEERERTAMAAMVIRSTNDSLVGDVEVVKFWWTPPKGWVLI